MSNYKLTYLLTLLIPIIIWGCAKDSLRGSANGQLQLSIGAQSPELILKAGVKAPADMGFSVQIIEENGRHSYSIPDSRELPTEGLEIAAGVYIISASSIPDSNLSSWGAATYSGSSKVTVKPAQTTIASVTCKLSNTMVSAEADESVASFFSSWSLSVNNGIDTVVFSNTTGSESDTAYFDVTGVLNYSIKMLTDQGLTYTEGPVSINDVKAARHYRFQLTTKSDGSILLAIVLDGNKVYSMDSEESTSSHTESITTLIGDSSERKASFVASRGIVSLVLCHEDAALKAAGIPEWTDLVSSTDLNALQAAGVECSKVAFGSKDMHTISFGSMLANLGLGDYRFKVIVRDIMNLCNEVVFEITVVPVVESKILSARAWATFAVIKGEWITNYKPAGLRFQYRKESDSEWTDIISAVRTDENTKGISADIYNLEPGTSYVCRTVTDADIAGGKDFPELSFSTDSRMPTVPYMNFDNWYKDGDAWMPNPSGAPKVWDTANPGTASLGTTPTTPEESDVVSGKAVRMESAVAGLAGINKFAAGNIYLGQFGGLEGMGAKLNWGYPFNGRPVALRGYYKYIPKPIDYAEAPYTGLKGTPDWGSIRIFLCDWSSQFIINTSKKIFLQEDDPSVIAVSSLYFNETNSSYQHFTLPVHYNDNRIPTYIEIACAASRYGDYFTGGKGSVLLIDEFELVYDPADLSDEEREAIGYRQL
ncbi:MAG: PCMD domain-containing protein [Bacteroidales bacterium]|nr:PCMD domain-containing protein [Bacteroidales bacterium]